MVTTLVLTRKPDYLFQSTEFPRQHGRFGTLIVLIGSKVKAVQVVPGAGQSPFPTGCSTLPPWMAAMSERSSAIRPSNGWMA
jgi:hypothetical protein